MLVPMRGALLVGLSLIAGGAIIVALPDTDRRLFSLSEQHGPSPLDAGGIALLVAGSLVFVVVVVRRRMRVLRHAGVAGFAVGASLLAVGLGLVGWSVAGDHGAWWILGAALAALPQIGALALAR